MSIIKIKLRMFLAFATIFGEVYATCERHSETLLCSNTNLQLIQNTKDKDTIKSIIVKQLEEDFLPEAAFNFPNLEKLAISGHLRITDTSSLRNLVQLTKLSITHTNLIHIPNDLFEIHDTLKECNVSHNKLTHLTVATFYNLSAIEILDLSYNNISYLNLGVFDDAHTVQKLFIHHNTIVSLPLGVFDELHTMIQLDLSFNDIKEIPLGIFDESKQLQNIDVSHNKLQSIDPWLFSNQVNLIYLNISHNGLVDIEDEIYDTFKNLKEFEIAGNPWECKCLEKILKHIVLRNVTFNHKYYFDGRRPVCVSGNLFGCAVNKNNIMLYRETYHREHTKYENYE